MPKMPKSLSPTPHKFSARTALAAAMTVAALAIPMVVAAQDLSVSETIIVGAIKDPAIVETITDANDAAAPALPVVYEDAQSSASSANAAEPSAQPSGSGSDANLGHIVELD
jgi:hypothetical protein